MRLSICIPTFNARALTRECFESLLATLPTAGSSTELDYEIIVVDDMSTDGTPDYLRSLKHPFTVVLNEVNRGYAFCNNLAAQMSRGEILCFLNADTILLPGWWKPMLEVFEKRKDAGMVGNIQWNPLACRYDHMGVLFDENMKPAHFGLGWRYCPLRGVKAWPVVTTACAMMRREVFLKLGGFDEAYCNGFEDTDLCLRARQNGFVNRVACGSRIVHFVSSSPGRHDNDDENFKLFLSRWSSYIKAEPALQSRRINSLNYLLRYADCPWKYNGAKLWRAVKGIW